MTSPDAMKSLEPLPEVPGLSHRVHAQLERLILTRVLPPGTRLVEGELAQTLGVSRGPIRVALQQLAQDRFVEIRPRQGAFVRVPTDKEIDDFFDLRRVLEGESARLAATRITPDGAEALRDCIRRGRDLLAKKKDPASDPPYLHQIISAIADNEQLSQYLELHNKRSVWYKAPFEPSRRRKSWDEHARVVDAIVRGDGEGAVAAMHAHIDAARAHFLILARASAER